MKRQKNSISTDPFGTYSFKTGKTIPEMEAILRELVEQDPLLNNCCLTTKPFSHFITRNEKGKPAHDFIYGTKFYIDGLKQQGAIIITHENDDMSENVMIIDDSSLHDGFLPDLIEQDEEDEAKELEKENTKRKLTIEFHRADRALAKYLKQKLSGVLVARRNPPQRENDAKLKKLCYLFSLLNVAEKSKYQFTDSAIESARSIYFDDYVEISMQIARAHERVTGLLNGKHTEEMTQSEMEDILIPTNPIKVIYWRGRKLILRRKIEIVSEKTKQKLVLYYRVDPVRRKFIFGLVENR